MIERIIYLIDTYKEISPTELRNKLALPKEEYYKLNEILKKLELDGKTEV